MSGRRDANTALKELFYRSIILENMLPFSMNFSTFATIAGFALAVVFASLLFAVEMKGILRSGTRRGNSSTRRPTQPEFTPSATSLWMSEKFLALSAAAVAFVIILFTK